MTTQAANTSGINAVVASGALQAAAATTKGPVVVQQTIDVKAVAAIVTKKQ